MVNSGDIRILLACETGRLPATSSCLHCLHIDIRLRPIGTHDRLLKALFSLVSKENGVQLDDNQSGFGNLSTPASATAGILSQRVRTWYFKTSVLWIFWGSGYRDISGWGAISNDDDRKDVLVGGGGHGSAMKVSEPSASSTDGHGGFWLKTRRRSF